MDFRTDILPLKDKLFRFALRITMQREEAEDIVQEVMIKLWNNRNSWDTIDNIESYAITICRNLSLDHLRRRSNNIVPLDDVESSATKLVSVIANPEQQLHEKEKIQQINAIINQLPEKQRSCMQLRDFEGKSYKEIADIMQITEDQVKINIFRARNFIKKSCTQV